MFPSANIMLMHPNPNLSSNTSKELRDNLHNLYRNMQSIRIQVEHPTVLACIVYVTGITSFLLYS